MSGGHSSPWIQCPCCLFKVRLNELRKMWPGIWACEFCWDPKPIDAEPPYKPKRKEGMPDKRGQGKPVDSYLPQPDLPTGAWDPSTYDPNQDYT